MVIGATLALKSSWEKGELIREALSEEVTFVLTSGQVVTPGEEDSSQRSRDGKRTGTCEEER